MKNFIVILTVIAGFIACTKNNKSFEINGKLSNITNTSDSYIYFENFVNNQPNKIDSAKINADGSFKIVTTNPALDFYRLSIKPDNFAIVILDSTNKPHFELNAINLSSNGKSKGAKHTQLLWDYYASANELDVLRDSIGKVLQGGNVSPDTRNQLINDFQKRQTDFYNYLISFVKKNADSPATMAVLNKLDPVKEFDLYKKVESELSKSMGHSGYYVFLTNQIKQAQGRVAQEKARQEQERKREALLGTGKEAPEINLPTPEGNLLPLSSLRGKVVLLDFWASWCKPCRAENPNVVRMYNKYKNKGFTVYSVSLDRSKDAWLRAIKQDNMTWNHVSDLKYWQSEAAQLYGVSGIPFTVLIDKEGKIIGTNLRGPKLEASLKQIFG